MSEAQIVVLEAQGADGLAACAARRGSETVGLAAADLGAGGKAKLRTLFVQPDHWRRGIGRALLAGLEARARALGAAELEAMFEAGGPAGAAALALAEGSGYRPSQPRTVVCRADIGRFAAAPLLGRGLPAPYAVFPWTELGAAEAELIRRRQEQAPYFPESLSPFRGPPCAPAASLGLRHSGQVVGWMVVHPLGPALLRFSALFVEPAHRGTGLGLLAESIRRAVAAGCTQGIFGVNASNQEMLPILDKHLGPYMTERRELLYYAKALGGPPDGQRPGGSSMPPK